MGQTQDHRHRVLVAAAKNIKNWFVKVRKIKAIYHTLNLFNLDVTQKCLIAECWVPVLDLENIQLALRRGTVRIILRVAVKNQYWFYKQRYRKLFFFTIFYNFYFLGTQRQFRPADSQSDGHVGRSADLQSHQQVHLRLPNADRLLRYRRLQGNESGALYHHYFPVLVRRNVRRFGPRILDGIVRGLDGAQREAFGRQEIRQRGKSLMLEVQKVRQGSIPEDVAPGGDTEYSRCQCS